MGAQELSTRMGAEPPHKRVGHSSGQRPPKPPGQPHAPGVSNCNQPSLVKLPAGLSSALVVQCREWRMCWKEVRGER